MKTIFTMLIGVFFGFALCYWMAPSNLNSHITTSSQPVVAQSNQSNYNHDEEGNRLQTLEMLELESQLSTEGNSAELFALDKSCKIRVNIVGETNYRYRTFYFQNHQLTHAMQTSYYYPHGGLTNMDAPNAFEEELYSEEILNPQSSLVVTEFKTLLARFSPHYLTKC